MSTSAKVICDSVSESGIRLTTLVLEFPRIVLAEFNTHRQFSRNASSSRAIPVEKQIQRIEKDPFIPTYWGKNQKGMQADEELAENISHLAKLKWHLNKKNTIEDVQELVKYGVHKQLANRLLEPFSYIQVIVTATEWDNFFLQRLDKNAQPEIQELARDKKVAMDESKPKVLKPTTVENFGWHLPFVTQQDIDEVLRGSIIKYSTIKEMRQVLIKISVARCARVSYGMNERGWGDIEKDLGLYEMLASNNHWSPFEHQATPMINSINLGEPPSYWQKGVTHMDRNQNNWSGNFKGWVQNRQLIQQQ